MFMIWISNENELNIDTILVVSVVVSFSLSATKLSFIFKIEDFVIPFVFSFPVVAFSLLLIPSDPGPLTDLIE